jgi:cystine transport system substrate-binding protein
LKAGNIMSKITNTVAAVAAAAVLATLAISPAQAAPKTITVATEGTYAPFSFHAKAGGPLVGYDVEVIKAVAKDAGYTLVFKETTWDTIFAGLEAKRWDAIANQVTINDTRKAKYDFTVPYTVDNEVVVARKADNRVATTADVKGLTAAQSATSNHRVAAEGLGAKIEVVPGFVESLALLTAQRVDVTLNSRLAVLEYLSNNKNSGLKIAATLPGNDLQGVVFLKGSKFTAPLNKSLKKLLANGTIAKLSKKYFGEDVSK